MPTISHWEICRNEEQKKQQQQQQYFDMNENENVFRDCIAACSNPDPTENYLSFIF